MLARPEDRKILDLSAGKLRWIVLDEAHTYMGSQAAELSLLLRRVIHAFGVDSGSVRFIATSATISNDRSGEATEKLKTYLADLAGISSDRVTVIQGSREIPDIPQELREMKTPLPLLASLEGISPIDRYTTVASSPPLRRVRKLLTKEGPQDLSTVASILTGKERKCLSSTDRLEALRYMDYCSEAIRDEEVFLPLRGHLFHRTQSGLWACSNPTCPGKKGTALAEGDWLFGRIYLERRAVCGESECGAIVFPLLLCDTCGAEYLSAEETLRGEQRFLVPREETYDDDDLEEEDKLLDESSQLEEGNIEIHQSIGFPRLLSGARGMDDVLPVPYEPSSGELEPPVRPAGSVRILLPDPQDDRFQCSRCRDRDTYKRQLFRPARIGASFFLRVGIPTLLESAPTMGQGLPNKGRRLLTFTDSRQGSAVFALQTQIDAERNYTRSWIYQQVWANKTVCRRGYYSRTTEARTRIRARSRSWVKPIHVTFRRET